MVQVPEPVRVLEPVLVPDPVQVSDPSLAPFLVPDLVLITDPVQDLDPGIMSDYQVHLCKPSISSYFLKGIIQIQVPLWSKHHDPHIRVYICGKFAVNLGHSVPSLPDRDHRVPAFDRPLG